MSNQTRFAVFFLAVFLMSVSSINGQSLSAKWEELTVDDFTKAIEQSRGVIIEKHGPHLPLGTDLINVRYAVLHRVEQEYAVVFPSTISARSLKRSTSRGPLPTAPGCNLSCCRKPPMRWAERLQEDSDCQWVRRQQQPAAVLRSIADGLAA